MDKFEPTEENTQSIPAARYNMHKRPAKITIPASKPSKRVYRTGGGLVSLHKTPEEFISVVESNAQQSILLRLPAELRNKIFKYALGGTRIEHRWDKARLDWCNIVTDGDASLEKRVVIALPRVCRQIYNETATLVYSANIFHFRTCFERDRCLFLLRQAQIEAMTAIRFDPTWGAFVNGAEGLRKTLDSLSIFTELKTLYLGRYPYLWKSSLAYDKIKEAKAAVVKGQAGDIKVIFV